MVECLPSKQETRVRFSYAAQKYKKRYLKISLFVFLCGVSKQLLGLRRESNGRLVNRAERRCRYNFSSGARALVTDSLTYFLIQDTRPLARRFSSRPELRVEMRKAKLFKTSRNGDRFFLKLNLNILSWFSTINLNTHHSLKSVKCYTYSVH